MVALAVSVLALPAIHSGSLGFAPGVLDAQRVPAFAAPMLRYVEFLPAIPDRFAFASAIPVHLD